MLKYASIDSAYYLHTNDRTLQTEESHIPSIETSAFFLKILAAGQSKLLSCLIHHCLVPLSTVGRWG